MQYSLYWPATTVHPLVWLVNGEPQYGKQSMTSPPDIRQRRQHAGDQRPGHARSARQPSPVTNRKALPNS